MMIPLVLGRGIDIGQIIGILFLVISVLSWFVNVVQGNSNEGQPRAQKPRPKPQSGQSEIESLLQELAGNKPKPQPEKVEPRRPKPPVERPRSKQQSVKQKPPVQTAAHTARPAVRVADSQLPSANLGASVRTHQLGNRVEAAVERDVAAAVQHDLGNRIAAATPTPERPVHPLVKVLRDPNGVRQAILLNEILQRPKSFRH